MTNWIKYQKGKVVGLCGQPFLFLFIPIVLGGCQLLSKNKEVCKVGNQVLLSSELEERITAFYSHLPKKKAHKLAIANWIEQQQIFQAIKAQMPTELKKNQLKNAVNLSRLNLFELENEYISKQVDSIITDKEIIQFYNKHRDKYRDASYIVRALYIKIPDSIDKEIHLEKYYLLRNKKDLDYIEKCTDEYALNLYFESKRWIYLDDLLREIPLSESEKEQLIKVEKHGVFHQNGETHYINIIDYNTKTVSSPLEIEKETIRTQILKQKASALRQNAKEIILQHVKEKYPVTYF